MPPPGFEPIPGAAAIANAVVDPEAGFGCELASWVERATWGDRPVRLAGLIDDLLDEPLVNDCPVWRLEEAARLHPGAYVVAAVGRPDLRERLILKAEGVSLVAAPPIIHPAVEYDRTLRRADVRRCIDVIDRSGQVVFHFASLR